MQPTIVDLARARQAFEQNQPRDLIYRASTELVRLSLQAATELSVPEALVTSLIAWNSNSFRFKKNVYDEELFVAIEHVYTAHRLRLTQYRLRSIESYSESDDADIHSIYADFENVLGIIGASKALHLMAPNYFVIWDTEIARVYGIPLSEGTKADRYCKLMGVTKQLSATLGGIAHIGRNPVKALDEFNYCRYTRGWI